MDRQNDKPSRGQTRSDSAGEGDEPTRPDDPHVKDEHPTGQPGTGQSGETQAAPPRR